MHCVSDLELRVSSIGLGFILADSCWELCPSLLSDWYPPAVGSPLKKQLLFRGDGSLESLNLINMLNSRSLVQINEALPS